MRLYTCACGQSMDTSHITWVIPDMHKRVCGMNQDLTCRTLQTALQMPHYAALANWDKSKDSHYVQLLQTRTNQKIHTMQLLQTGTNQKIHTMCSSCKLGQIKRFTLCSSCKLGQIKRFTLCSSCKLGQIKRFTCHIILNKFCRLNQIFQAVETDHFTLSTKKCQKHMNVLYL